MCQADLRNGNTICAAQLMPLHKSKSWFTCMQVKFWMTHSHGCLDMNDGTAACLQELDDSTTNDVAAVRGQKCCRGIICARMMI